MKILAVDDDVLMLKFINTALLSENHEVQNASSVDEALMLIQNNDYDLVITDIVMPGYDGTTLMQYIRDKGESMPILAITAGVENAVSDYKNYADFFSNETLTKPFAKDELLNSVKKLTAAH